MALTRGALCGAALVGALWARPAAAEIPGLSLSWQAPSGCPAEVDIERAVLEGRLDRVSTPGRQVAASVKVERRPDGTYRAELTTVAPEGRGTRVLEGESCDAIASASAVVLALALDPPSDVPPPPPPPPPQPSVPPAVPREPWVPYLHAFGGGVLRVLPEPAMALGLGAGVRRGSWDAELLLSLAPSQVTHAAKPVGAGATLSLLSAQGMGCFSPVRSNRAALEVCAGVLVERLAGDPHGISNPSPNSIVLVSPELALRSRTRVLPRLELALDATGTARPVQPRFVIGGVGQVHEIPVFDGLFQVGLMLSF